jgi:hypothetical protein
MNFPLTVKCTLIFETKILPFQKAHLFCILQTHEFSIYSCRYVERSWKIKKKSLKPEELRLHMCTNDKKHYSGRRRRFVKHQIYYWKIWSQYVWTFRSYLLQDSTSFKSVFSFYAWKCMGFLTGNHITTSVVLIWECCWIPIYIYFHVVLSWNLLI